MKFSFTANGRSYTAETLVRVKDSSGNLKIVDTAAVLGSRYVSDARKESDKQVVVLSDSNGIFSQSLLTDDGKSIRVVLDKAQGIINPYLTINNWSVRETTAVGNNVTVSSSLCPFPIEDLPATIPLEHVGVGNATNQSVSSKTQKPVQSSDGMNTALTIAAATVGAFLSSSKGKTIDDNSDESYPKNIVLGGRSNGDGTRASIIEKLRASNY